MAITKAKEVDLRIRFVNLGSKIKNGINAGKRAIIEVTKYYDAVLLPKTSIAEITLKKLGDDAINLNICKLIIEGEGIEVDTSNTLILIDTDYFEIYNVDNYGSEGTIFYITKGTNKI